MIEDLYELIGGRSTVEAATELFYKKILEDGAPYLLVQRKGAE